ncbi:MAG: cytosine/adenosine deaminase-related metal-dependent hydrolase [Gammaproteobacteria bacterium]|jgi:cytosine/adenosine deaminase-related metal-dependent hydrolase
MLQRFINSASLLFIIGLTQPVIAQIPEVLVMWPDIIYVNGVIVTMDDTRMNDNPGSIVQAMAVRDERIIALGSDDEIRKLKGPETEVVDLEGNQVLPGLIDSHQHIMWPAVRRAIDIYSLKQVIPGYFLEISVERTAEEILAKMDTAIKALRERVDVGIDQWIGISIFPDTAKGFPSIASVSNLAASIEPENSDINFPDLDKMVPDRMFVLDSATSLQANPTGGAEFNTWVEVIAGPDGGPIYKELFMLDEWDEWEYE